MDLHYFLSWKVALLLLLGKVFVSSQHPNDICLKLCLKLQEEKYVLQCALTQTHTYFVICLLHE